MLNTIFNESNLITLQRMEDDYIDLTVTSPPYNVDLGNNKFNKNPYDLYNDNKEHQQYIANLKEVFLLIYAKTKVGGRCAINIGGGKNGSVPTHADIITMMAGMNWLPMTTIVWDKGNVNSRTAWGSYLSPSAPSFPTPFEYILVFAKESRKLITKGTTDLTKEEFSQWSLAKWSFPGISAKKTGHPAAFPVELPTRLIKMLSWQKAIVYDPFMGSGTTAIACIETGRNFIGSEISSEYCEIANNRIAEFDFLL